MVKKFLLAALAVIGLSVHSIADIAGAPAGRYVTNRSTGAGEQFNVSHSTAASFVVSDLTSGQCVQAGTGGRLTVSGSACGSGGGGGSSSLEIMANNLRVSSPTATAKFNGTSDGIGINATTSGSTATLTFSMLPGNANYIQNPATGTWVNTKGIVGSTITATSIGKDMVVYAGSNGLLSGSSAFKFFGSSATVRGDTVWTSPPLIVADGDYGAGALAPVGPSIVINNRNSYGGSSDSQQCFALNDTNKGCIGWHSVVDGGNGEGGLYLGSYGSSNSGNTAISISQGICSGGRCKSYVSIGDEIATPTAALDVSAPGIQSGPFVRIRQGSSGNLLEFTNNENSTILSTVTYTGDHYIPNLYSRYGVTATTITASGLASGQCVQTGAGGLLTVTGSACGSGGGGGSGGYNLQPATVTVQVPLGIYGSTFSFTGPQQSTVTYGLTVGTLTVANAAGGNLSLSNDNGSSFYQVVGSSSDATVGQCAVWTSSWTVVSGPCGTGGGGGGGSVGGTINNANQFSLTYYSVAGSSNALSGSSIASVYASSMTLNTSTQTARQVLFDYSASSMTISSITANAVYADRIEGLPYNTKPYFTYGLETPVGIAIDAPGALTFYQSNTFSNGVAFISSASLNNQVYQIMSAYPTVDGQVLSARGPNTFGYYDLYWKDDASGGGSGGGGYALQPATVTIRAPYSIEASSVNFSSNTILTGTTFYANGSINTSADIRANGLTYLNAFSYLSVATDLPGVLSAPINGYHNSAIAAGDVPVGLFGYNINTGSVAPTTGHGLGVLGYTSDATGSRHPQYGVEGRTLGRGLNTTDYSGLLAVATHAGPFNGILAGVTSRTETYASDETTPTSTGTVYGSWIKAPIGSGAVGQTFALYNESPYPSYHLGKLGIGSGTTNPSANLYINTAGNLLQGMLILSGQTTTYAFTQLGRASPDMSIAVSAGADQFFTGTKAGDTVIRAENAGNTFHIGAGSSGSASLLVNNSSVTFPASVYMNGPVNISSVTYLGGTVGGAGQVYTSNGPGSSPSWSTPSGSGDAVLAATQTWTGGNTLKSSTTFDGAVRINSVSTITFNTASIEVSTIGLVSNIQFQDSTVMRTSPEYYSTTADSTTVGSVLSTSTLTMPVLANTTYYFDCYIMTRTTTTTTGTKLAVLSPTVTGSTITYNAAIPLAADAAAGMWFGWGTTSDDPITSTSMPTTNWHMSTINGRYVSGPNGAGNLNVRFASELPNSPTIIMRAGSYCEMRRPLK